jgi:hypothetical protein
MIHLTSLKLNVDSMIMALKGDADRAALLVFQRELDRFDCWSDAGGFL